MPRFVLLLLCGVYTASSAAEFKDVIKKPSKFHDKRVTLVAMANVGGDRFYLYQPPKPNDPGMEGRVIYGLLSREGPVYDRFENKWVQVTGIVDASYRGLVSENACGLRIERVRPLGKPQPSEPKRSDHACFKMPFSRLLKTPRTEQGKYVCIIGFAHAAGDAFVIYENKSAAAKPDFSKGIFVSQKFRGQNCDRYDKQWIKIAGVVDMEQRGFADYPCGIILERAEAARPPY